MGGPGVVLSQETLVRVVPHINYCLQHLLTSHEDVELGRCIHQFVGVTCTWSYEVLPEDTTLSSNLLMKKNNRRCVVYGVSQ